MSVRSHRLVRMSLIALTVALLASTCCHLVGAGPAPQVAYGQTASGQQSSFSSSSTATSATSSNVQQQSSQSALQSGPQLVAAVGPSSPVQMQIQSPVAQSAPQSAAAASAAAASGSAPQQQPAGNYFDGLNGIVGNAAHMVSNPLTSVSQSLSSVGVPSIVTLPMREISGLLNSLG